MTAGKSETLVATDEQPPKARPEKIPTLKPAFREGGTVTAANSSSISDGAAALVMMRESEAEKRGAAPLARVVAHSTYAASPSKFPTAPIGALRKLFDKTGWGEDSSISSRSTKPSRSSRWRRCAISGFPHEKVNVNGGACALGHPIGASGARILVTLLAALRASGAKARRRLALHRRRRSDRHGDRGGVSRGAWRTGEGAPASDRGRGAISSRELGDSNGLRRHFHPRIFPSDHPTSLGGSRLERLAWVCVFGRDSIFSTAWAPFYAVIAHPPSAVAFGGFDSGIVV